MRYTLVTWRRLLFVATLVYLCLPSALAAQTLLTADFDGDGQHDRVSVDAAEPGVLHVWLSSTGTTTTIRTATSLRTIVARDLDGDRRAELIASDARAGLRVWTKKRHGFRSFRPRPTGPGAVKRPARRSIDDRPTSDSSEISSGGAASLALELSAHPRGPDTVSAAVVDRSCHPTPSALHFSPFAPRPPPPSAL